MAASKIVDEPTIAAFGEMERIEDIQECARLVAIGGMAARYNEIAELAYTDHHAAIKALQSLEGVPSNSFPELMWVRNAILAHICNIMVSRMTPAKTGVSEMDIQNHFFKHLDTYVKDAVKTECKTTKGHRPDGFVSVNGEVFPVEIKVKTFRKKSLEQLEWYMRIYGAKYGIAVAPELSCELPANVTFVKITHGDVTQLDHTKVAK